MARRIVLTSESLVRLTCHVTAFRFRLEKERNERQKLMALQIKGLRENMLALRGIVSEINGQAQTAIEKGTQLKGHIGDLSTELADHVSDIEFAAGIMGNSAPGSSNGSGAGEKPQKPPVVPPNVMAAVGDRNEPKASTEHPLVRLGPNPIQMEVGKELSTTFPDEHHDDL